MSELAKFDQETKSVFSLNGHSEDSATYALGWALHKSDTLLEVFVSKCITVSSEFSPNETRIDLQKKGKAEGFTDIEIQQPNLFHLIVEAKRNWELPSLSQLTKYASRFVSEKDARQHLLVSVSAASAEYADKHLPKVVQNVRTKHFSWNDIFDIARTAKQQAKSFEEKIWLRELLTHIQGYKGMTSPIDNRAYCVVLSGNEINKDTGYTWVDVIQKDNAYFHPVGGSGNSGWPATPPNYMAFRKNGKLMSVHHVESYDVVSDVSTVNPNWVKTNSDHFVYKLGKPMVPAEPLKNGKLYATARVWCALDTLLSGTYKTIAEARDETKRRLG